MVKRFISLMSKNKIIRGLIIKHFNCNKVKGYN